MGTEPGRATPSARTDAGRVILLGGPSGSGKSTLVRPSGLAILALDDFYRDGSDPTLPRHPELGIVDWDDPAAWDGAAALAAVERLCEQGAAEVPIYSFGADGATGTRTLRVGPGPFVAEGIFAEQLITPLRERGLLLDAIVVDRSRWKNLARRTVRDLRQRRKPPVMVARRGLQLLRTEKAVVARATAAGCRPLGAAQVTAALSAWARGADGRDPRPES